MGGRAEEGGGEGEREREREREQATAAEKKGRRVRGRIKTELLNVLHHSNNK